MDSVQNARIILSIPNVQLCRIEKDVTQLLEMAEMNFAELPSKQIMFTIGQHFYTLQKSVPIYLTAFETSRSYLYQYLTEVYSIILQDATHQQYYEQINQILSSNAMLVIKDKQGKQFEKEGYAEGKELPPPKPKSNYQKLTEGVSSVGTTLSKGIVAGGSMFAAGITQFGGYIESKITPGKPTEISDSTKQNVKMVKDASGKLLQVTGEMAKQIVEMNVTLASMMADTVVQVSGLDKKMNSNKKDPKMEELKQLGHQSLESTIQVLDSLDQAASQVGKAIGQQATRIIEKKYGKDASEVAQEGFEIAENTGKAYKDVKQAEMKSIAKATAKETAKQVGQKM